MKSRTKNKNKRLDPRLSNVGAMMLVNLSAPAPDTLATYIDEDGDVFSLPVVQFGMLEAPSANRSGAAGLVSSPDGLIFAEGGYQGAEFVGYWMAKTQDFDEFCEQHGIAPADEGEDDEVEGEDEDDGEPENDPGDRAAE